MKAGLKSCVTILGVITVLAVILCAVLLPAIVLPFTANMNVAGAADINSNLFKNSSFIENTRGEAEYSSAGSNAVPTLDNWYISGYCSFDAYSLAIIPVNSTGRSGLLLQPIKLTNSGTYTVAINFKSVEQSMSRIEAFTNVLIDGVKIDLATSGAPGHFYLNRLNNNLYVGTFTVTDSLLNSINSDSTLELAIGFGIISSCVLDFAKLEQGSDYTGYEPPLSDFEALKSKYDALFLKYSQLQNELESLQVELQEALDKIAEFGTLPEDFENLKKLYEELQRKNSDLLKLVSGLQSTITYEFNITFGYYPDENNLSSFTDKYINTNYFIGGYRSHTDVNLPGSSNPYPSYPLYPIANSGLKFGIPFFAHTSSSSVIVPFSVGRYAFTFGNFYGFDLDDIHFRYLYSDNVVGDYINFTYNEGTNTDGRTATLFLDIENYCNYIIIEFDTYGTADYPGRVFIEDFTAKLPMNNYNVVFEEGKKQGYDEGYRVGQEKGYAEGSKAQGDYSFLGLIGAVIDAPINSFRQMFDFDVLGVNMSSFMLSLFTISIIIVIIKLVI